ncbi:anti-sigma factor [Nocardioides sp. LML1-1-1.1]|uniref:anti-sigma factor n=1 Tax=Nocardioides sp. LML1-1-1.1 TaxID=3135248 RepID=UPI003442A45F
MTDHEHALSGAYAVDALDAEERARFEAHLRECRDCQEEVASLQEAAALLGTDPVEPPASVRDAVLASIQSIRPLPPIVETPAAVPAEVDQLAERRARRGLVHRLTRTPLLVAAAVVLLLAVGTALVRPWTGDDTANEPPTAADRVLSAADATEVAQAFPDGSKATLVVSRSQGKAVIRTRHMALPPSGKTYQLWLQSPAGEMVPAGLMPEEADTTYVLDGDASKATGVGITVEPDGGSDHPTSKPIALFPLEA